MKNNLDNVFVLAIGVFLATWSHDLSGQTIKFTDISRDKQVQGLKIGDIYQFGHGIACADINLDGLPDFYVSNAAEVVTSTTYPEVLYVSHANAAFTEEANGVRGVYDNYGIGSHGVVFFDMDNDGDFDLFNANTGQAPIHPTIYNRLYRNRSDGLFKDISKAAGIQELGMESFARSVVAFDANNDGLMDIYSVGDDPSNYAAKRNLLFINQGNEKFRLEDWGAAFINADGFGPNGVTAADIDNDGDQEIYISRVDREMAGVRAANQLLEKQPNGQYKVRYDPKIAGLGWSDGATFADYDNDGDLDLFVSSSNDRQWRKVCIYQNQGDGTFIDRSDEKAIFQRGFTPVLFDVDNDGDLDLFTPSTYKALELMRLHLNDGRGNFTTQEKTGLEVSIFDTRGVSVADIDNDGDLDIYLTDTNKGGDPQFYNRLMRNDLSGSSNRWLKIYGRGPKGDAGAFGSKIWIFEKGYMDDMTHLVGYKQIISTYGFCSQDDPVQHFGIGLRDTVAVKIVMTDGTTLKNYKVATNRKLTFSRPARLEKTAGDGQSGGREQMLLVPLKVTVYDAYSKLVKGAEVQFQSTDGQVIETQPVYTDDQGVAQIHFILGKQSAVQKVTVRAPWLPGLELGFTENMLIIPKEIQLASQSNPSGFAGAFLADSVKVRVMDDEGLAKPGQPVQFELLSGSGSLYPGGFSNFFINTNSNGFAAVAWKLGKASGTTQQQMAIRSSHLGSPLVGSPITVSATVEFADTLLLAKTDGDQQIGPASGVLLKLLLVRLTSISGLPIPPQAIRFKVISGLGKVNEMDSVTVTTNDLGQASVSWRLGPNFRTLQKVMAFLVSKPIHQVIFTATATAIPKQLRYTGLTEFSGQVNMPVNDQLTAQVTDDEGTPILNHAVTFKVLSGNGKMNGQDSVRLQTDADGYVRCQWVLGPKSGKRNNEAQIVASGLKNSPVRLLATAAPGRPFRLVKISGDNQSAGPKRDWPQPIKVQVTDSLQNGVAGQSVEFNVTQGDVLLSGSTQLFMISDSSGYVVAYGKMGVTPGPVQIIAVSLYAEQNIQNSPLHFSATLTPPVPSHLVYAGAVEFTGQVGKLLPDFISVQVTDDTGFPVKGFNINFKVLQGGGRINNQDSVTVLTDDQGMAKGQWQLGTISGKRNNRLQVKGASLQGSPLTLYATALAGRPFQMSKIAGDGQTAGPRSSLPIPLTVLITDSLQNKLYGQSVLFQVQQGDATFSGSAQIAMLTDSSGLARAVVKFGVNPGTVQIRVSAQTSGQELQDSPLLFTETMTPPVASQLRWLGLGEYFGQVGRTLHDALLAQVTDDDGTPIIGHPVSFQITLGSGHVSGKDSIKVFTDNDGYVRCTWLMGPLTASRGNEVLVFSPGLKGSPVRVWATGMAPRAFKIVKVAGDEQSGFPLTMLARPLQVLVTDSLQYPVAEQTVSYQITQGDAHFNPASLATVMTDSNGVASATAYLGTLPGVIQIAAACQINSRHLQGSPLPFDADLILPTINRSASYLIADTSMIANGRALVRLQAVLLGQENQPLSGLHIRFGVTGNANNLIQPSATTSSQGTVEGSLSSTRAEVKKVWAQVLYSSLVLDTIRVRFTPGPAAVLKKVTGDGQSGAIRQRLDNPLVVALSDSFANPISASLLVQEKWPDAGLYSLPEITTDPQGLARYYWTLGSQPGAYQLILTLGDLPPVSFQANATPREAGQVKITSGDNQSGRPGLFLVVPLAVQVFDTFNEPFVGASVRFQVAAGGGVLYPLTTVLTDSLGYAAVNWQVGLTGEQKVAVTLIGAEQLGTQFTASLLKNNLPVIRCPKDTTIQENQKLIINVSAGDADNDSLAFGVGQMPESATFDKVTRQFVWTPGFRHAGLTKIAFWVQDSFGGKTNVIVAINVIDVPAPPMITGYTPSDSSLQMKNQDLTFSVSASDMDGNYLYYSWWLNGVLVAPTGSEYTLRYKSTLPSRTRLAVHVSDGQFTVEHVWRLDIQSSVLKDSELPTQYALLQNYPNPFNPTTRIQFALVRPGRISLRIIDNSGRLVRVITDAFYAAGRYELEWDGRDEKLVAVASGVYLCMMTCEGYSGVRKLVLMK